MDKNWSNPALDPLSAAKIGVKIASVVKLIITIPPKNRYINGLASHVRLPYCIVADSKNHPPKNPDAFDKNFNIISALEGPLLLFINSLVNSFRLSPIAS